MLYHSTNDMSCSNFMDWKQPSTEQNLLSCLVSADNICSIDHFTVVCSVTRPLNDSEVAGDFVLTPLLLLCKSSYSCA